MRYLIRSCKYFVYIAVIFCAIVAIIFYTSDHTYVNTPLDLFKEGSGIKMLAFFICFSLVYPLAGYQKKEIYHNGNLMDYKAQIVELFENARYKLVKESDTSLEFRLKNRAMAFFTKMTEDAITIDCSENPAKISGLRKDVLRFSRGIEGILAKAEEE